jgi:hypothetical protein
MLLSLLGAPELSSVCDEDVVPLAAEMAHTLRHLDPAKLPDHVAFMARQFEEGVGDRREVLRTLVAVALAVLAGMPGTTALYQAPEKTRPVRVSDTEYEAFRRGRLRHVVFTRGTYEAPAEGDVLQLLERRASGLTRRCALAEVLFASEGRSANGERYYIVSVRPWRGAGTDSAAQLVLSERARILEDAAARLRRVARDVRIPEDVEWALGNVAAAVDRAREMYGRPVVQAPQTSMRSSSSPSGHEGNVMAPPGKVNTNHMR